MDAIIPSLITAILTLRFQAAMRADCVIYVARAAFGVGRKKFAATDANGIEAGQFRPRHTEGGNHAIARVFATASEGLRGRAGNLCREASREPNPAR
jgi:hypothetical protein